MASNPLVFQGFSSTFPWYDLVFRQWLHQGLPFHGRFSLEWLGGPRAARAEPSGQVGWFVTSTWLSFYFLLGALLRQLLKCWVKVLFPIFCLKLYPDFCSILIKICRSVFSQWSSCIWLHSLGSPIWWFQTYPIDANNELKDKNIECRQFTLV